MNLQENTLLGGRYQIIRELGQGTFGQTYLAEDMQRFNEQVVVKRLMIESLSESHITKAKELFQREAMALYTLGTYDKTPHLKAHFEENDNCFLVMEYVAEKNMGEVELADGHRLSEKEVISLLFSILGILVTLHKNKLIHRDIKPDNLIRKPGNEQIVLIDFGSVTQELNLQQRQKKGIKTVTGNRGYAAPEQLQGHSFFSSDIYAVGMIAMQALTGIQPSELSDRPNWQRFAPNTSEDLQRIINRMTAQKASERYESADEVLSDLDKSFTKSTITTETSLPFKRWLPKIALTAAILGGILVFIWLWLSSRNTEYVFPSPKPVDIVDGTKIIIKGSINTLNKDKQFKSSFEAKFPLTKVEIERKGKDELGTESGFNLLCAGTINIAAASYFEEGKKCSDGKKLFAVRIGEDYLSIVVDKDNPIQGLTKSQVKDIFQCKYTKWNELDPTLSEQDIKVLNRSDTSGTISAFKKFFLNGEEFCQPNSPNFKNFSSPEVDELVNTARHFTVDDISYLGYGLAKSNKVFKVIPIDGVNPGQENYPYSRPLYYVYTGQSKEKPDSQGVKQFLGFVQNQ